MSLYHADRGNSAGSARLARTGRAYMLEFGTCHADFDSSDFWKQMDAYLADPTRPSPQLHPAAHQGTDL